MRLAKVIKTLEVACWCIGIALVGLYFALRAEGEIGRRAAISEFETATVPSRAISAMGQSRASNAFHASLNFPIPDKAHWSPGRIRAYEEAKAKGAGRAGFPVAVLRIPKVGLVVPVYAEDTARNMNRGAVLVSGTAAPGGSGNTAIAAHRDGYFRVLKDVSVGDLLVLETLSGTREYRIASLKVVRPTNISVLSQTSVPVVTLVTCYPFYFVGSAPRRFIVQAIALTQTRPEERTSSKNAPGSTVRTKSDGKTRRLSQSPGALKTYLWHQAIRLNRDRKNASLIDNPTGGYKPIRMKTFLKGEHKLRSGSR